MIINPIPSAGAPNQFPIPGSSSHIQILLPPSQMQNMVNPKQFQIFVPPTQPLNVGPSIQVSSAGPSIQASPVDTMKQGASKRRNISPIQAKPAKIAKRSEVEKSKNKLFKYLDMLLSNQSFSLGLHVRLLVYNKNSEKLQ